MQKLAQLINDAQNSHATAPPLTKASDPERFRGSPVASSAMTLPAGCRQRGSSPA
jgi:hypothetical protein